MKIDLNGISFRYEIDGPSGGGADAPWIVFSNSLTTDVTMWDHEVAQLKDRYRILRYDTRGHGQSGASPGPYSFAMLADDTVALMDHVGVAKAHFVGLSLGGMTGLYMAIHHADRLLSLASCDARAWSPPDYIEAWVGRMAIAREKGMEALVEPTIERWFTAPFRADPASAPVLDRVRQMIRETAVDGYTGCAEALRAHDERAGLAGISVPCLFMTGSEDTSTPPECAQEMAAAVPGAECVIVTPASHISNMENPDVFDAALFAHLERPG
jgi:3-oxoadipate enol-lactonase